MDYRVTSSKLNTNALVKGNGIHVNFDVLISIDTWGGSSSDTLQSAIKQITFSIENSGPTAYCMGVAFLMLMENPQDEELLNAVHRCATQVADLPTGRNVEKHRQEIIDLLNSVKR